MQDNLLRRVPILNVQLKKLRDTRKIIASWLKREKKDNSLSSISLDSFTPSNFKILQLKHS